MITKTVGSGGDYALWSGAWAWLVTQSPLADDHTFTQISSLTEDNWDTAAVVNFNGKTVIFEGNYAGDPTSCYITSLSGTKGRFSPRVEASFTLEYLLIIRGIYFKQITNSSLSLLSPNLPGYTAVKNNLQIYNCLIQGNTRLNGALIGLAMTQVASLCIIKIHNIISTNCGRGFIGGFGTGGFNLSTVLYENISVYNCGTGIETNVGNNYTTTYKNCVSFGCTKAFLGGAGDSNTSLINCADDDNSIVVSCPDNVKTNCITGITAADFISVDPTSSDFLKIDNQSALWETGTLDISSWNTEDIFGNSRPHPGGGVNIGVFEGEVIKTCRFYDSSQGVPDSYDLDFGDGTSHATSLSASHDYNLNDIGSPYQVSATLTVSADGLVDSVTKSISLI